VGTGTTGQATEDVVAALGRALRDQRALIVLDNLEGVLPAAAMLVEILALCPRGRLSKRCLLRRRSPRRTSSACQD
jgi:hypothetical protein